MEYAQVRTILYESDAMGRIPDKWMESVPVRCDIRGERVDAFLYGNPRDGKLELKRLVGVCRSSGAIIELGGEELAATYSLPTLVFPLPPIGDYDAFFRDQQEYEALYAALGDDDVPFGESGRQAYQLLKRIVGEEMLRDLFMKLSGNFIRRLQSGD